MILKFETPEEAATWAQAQAAAIGPMAAAYGGMTDSAKKETYAIADDVVVAFRSRMTLLRQATKADDGST